MPVMFEKEPLLPTSKYNKIEEEILNSVPIRKPTTSLKFLLSSDRVAFLLGYQMLALVANVYMTTKISGTAIYYYLANIMFTMLGLFGLTLLNSASLAIYTGYMTVSFLLTSFVSVTALIVVVQKDTCMILKNLVSDEIVSLCTNYPAGFKILGTASIFGELFLEMFVLWQVSEVYKNVIRHKGKLGTIKIAEPSTNVQ